MVSAENRTGLYVAVPLYFCLLAGAAFWAYRRMENMKHSGTADSLAAHYLGGRDFGPLMTAGTIFASLFSGYTVIGVPNEAYRYGWRSMRWMAGVVGLVGGYFGTGIRLRKMSLIRNHQSPVDFLTDRYQSQTLRYTILFLQVIPTVIYLAAQVIAIKGTFNNIFGLDPDANYPVIIIMAAILLFEWVGGLNSVALTDSIQAVVMVASFVILPSVVMKNFGGWSDLDPETYPKPEFYQTLSKDYQLDFWQFSMINFGFFTLPHFMQRTYAAKDLQSLKMGYTVMAIGPWFTLFVGIFLGTMGVSMLQNEDGSAADVPNPFAAILDVVMDLGGFARAAGAIAVTASLAAIMSTADSLIIAISQLITVEVVYPLRPSASPTEIAVVGKAVSFISVVLSLLVGIFWDEGISDLGRIQFSLSAQAIPAFIFGLYSSSATDVHPWCLSSGAIAAIIFVFGYFFGYVKPVADSIALDTGVMAIIINLTITLSLDAARRVMGGNSRPVEPDTARSTERTISLTFPGRPQWDVPLLSRFGDTAMSPELIWKAMEGVEEPLTNPWWCFAMVFVVSMATPITAEAQPPLDATLQSFLYPVPIINGLPWWVFKTIMLCIVPTIILLISIYRMPNEYPADENKIAHEGMDVNLVEMTQDELCRRSVYDEVNTSIQKRRSSISQSMEELGLNKSELMELETTPSQRRLAMLALQGSKRSLATSKRGSMMMEPVVEEGGVETAPKDEVQTGVEA